MGTHSLTYVMSEDGSPMACLYRQYDGYLSCHGLRVGSFLAGKRVVNGFGADDDPVFNGAGDLGLRLFAALKGDPGVVGGFYLVDPRDKHQVAEFHYYVWVEKGEIVIRVFQRNWLDRLELVFCGSPEELVDLAGELALVG